MIVNRIVVLLRGRWLFLAFMGLLSCRYETGDSRPEFSLLGLLNAYSPTNSIYYYPEFATATLAGARFGEIYTNDNTGQFTPTDLNTTSVQSTDIVISDFNNDGSNDIFVVHWFVNAWVFLNDGSGNLTETSITMAAASQGVGVGDFNGDGYADTFVANVSGAENRLCTNDGSGGFTCGNILTFAPRDSNDLAVADYDRDGDPDVAVCNSGALGRLYTNTGASFAISDIGSVSILARGIAAGDFNRDGSADLLVVATGQNYVHFNNGSGGFPGEVAATPNTLSSAGVEIADLDGDGDLDAFVVNEGAANFIYINDGFGNFSAVAADALTDTSKEVALADVDGDGDVDAVVANNGQNRLYRNNGDATFAIEDIGGNYISDGVAGGDLNGM